MPQGERAFTVALVVAAGAGQRAGGAAPKQYQPLRGRPMLRHCLDTFVAHPGVDATAVVIDPAHRALYDAATAGLDLLPTVAGGATRQQSCHLGLQALAQDPPDQVLIHDAARPFVSPAVVDRVLTALEAVPGALPALPVADTLKRAGQHTVTETVDRAGLWRAQTPQGFAYAPIAAAHDAARGRDDLTDDAAVAEAAGLAVAIVAGDPDNEKITTSEQLAGANAVSAQLRTGFGFDVHAFADGGDHVVLGGVPIAHNRSLAGHSDADVVFHAITDAVLGAIAAGDIGQHFPPSDDQWRGSASSVFLSHAAELVAAQGGRITNVDVTVICQAPPIGPHRAAMQAAIAETLGIAANQVGVKATTTEGLGFTGRGEGIAAQAVATVALP